MISLSNLALQIRERYHPLFHLRKVSLFRWTTKRFDVPIGVNFDSISHPVYVSLTRNLSFVLSSGKAGEEAERKNFLALVEKGRFKTFFDVGSNIGLYGFLFASAVKDGKIIMVEPDPENAKLIRKTISRSNVDRVQFIEAAVSDRIGSVTFHKDDITGATGSLCDGANSFLALHHKVRPSEITVSCIKLDDLSSGEATDPEFIKIDVEGVEISVLLGAEGILSRSHPAIFFECDENQAKVHSILSALNYIFFDFVSMCQVEAIPHNCLALHSDKHAAIIEWIAKTKTV